MEGLGTLPSLNLTLTPSTLLTAICQLNYYTDVVDLHTCPAKKQTWNESKSIGNNEWP